MILATGATGHIGRPLVEALCAQGVSVRAVTRDPAAGAFPPGVEVIEVDPSQPKTMAGVLRGVSGVFLNPMAVQSGYEALLTMGRDNGVERVVTLSAVNLHDDPAEQPSRMRGVNHSAIEAACLEVGFRWAALRIGTLAINALPMWAAQLQAGSTVRGPYMTSASSPLHERDVAEVAAKALLTGELDGARPELTGLNHSPSRRWSASSARPLAVRSFWRKSRPRTRETP